MEKKKMIDSLFNDLLHVLLTSQKWILCNSSMLASIIPYPSELHLARDIQVVPTEDCSRSLWNRMPEPLENLICVKISNRDNTNLLSDPGGILACSSESDTSKWELMGVLASYKTRVTGNHVRVFALYSRLDQHLNWILKEFTNSDTWTL